MQQKTCTLPRHPEAMTTASLRARERRRAELLAGLPNYLGEPIIVAIMVAIFFLIPVLSCRLAARDTAAARSSYAQPTSPYGPFVSASRAGQRCARLEPRVDAGGSIGREFTRRDAAKGGEAGRVYLSFENVCGWRRSTLRPRRRRSRRQRRSKAGKKHIKPSEMPPFWDTR